MCQLCRITNNKNLSFTEKQSTMRVSNPTQRLLEVQCVDGCKITNGIRCDWLLIDQVTTKEIYIELKGKNIEHAAEQIKASIDVLSRNRQQTKLGYIICSRSPLNSTEVQILQKAALRTHQMKLRVKKLTHQETIESLVS